MLSSVYEAQKPLKEQYKQKPDLAMVIDHAKTSGESALDPFHSRVEPMEGCGVSVPVGVHAAVGGKHDAPTPGDLLCAALAACQDSAIRMVANLMEIELLELEVRVTATADVRGALAMDRSVPVGFQAMSCDVRMKVSDDTTREKLERLQVAAKACCVVQQTLKSPPPVKTRFIS
ncbi:MAG: OsmC family protein [Amphritea sp.]|nr:OsmC family protein [Amphritea sp.]